MGARRTVPHVPAIREQLTRIELYQHLGQLTDAHAGVEAARQIERELVALVLTEGGTWADVAAATGMSRRAARRRWSALPRGNAKETNEALVAARATGGRGWRGPWLGNS